MKKRGRESFGKLSPVGGVDQDCDYRQQFVRLVHDPIILMCQNEWIMDASSFIWCLSTDSRCVVNTVLPFLCDKNGPKTSLM